MSASPLRADVLSLIMDVRSVPMADLNECADSFAELRILNGRRPSCLVALVNGLPVARRRYLSTAVVDCVPGYVLRPSAIV